MKNLLKKYWGLCIKSVFLLVSKYSVVLVWLVGFYYLVAVLTDYNSDTTSVTNAAFALLATLSALAFSYARTVEKDDREKDRLIYVGERFYHSCILFLCSSILKYAYLSLIQSDILSFAYAKYFLRFTVGSSIMLLFFYGINSAHTGLRIMNDHLWLKMSRYKDWDNIL